MNLKTVIRDKNERGQGVVYNASQDLDKECEVTFAFYLPQCDSADVRRIGEGDFSIAPKFVEYIEQHPNKIIGILVDAEVKTGHSRSLRLMNELIAGVAELNHENVHITSVIGL